MSGTSADGIDVALVRILGRGPTLRLRLLAHQHFGYPKAVRQAILAAMNATSARVADLACLNVLLGDLYAEALQTTIKRHNVEPDLVGCHGQTLYHQSDARSFLGRRIATTWQAGEGAKIAALLEIPVVSDFRPADLAVGGSGAPLVPLLDVAYYAHPKKLRVLQNLGGIANLTIMPAGTDLRMLQRVVAFDTGPGNMVMDACTQELLGKAFDASGTEAAKGKLIEAALAKALQHPFFRRRPPKATGREEFGREFVAQFLRWCGPRARKADVLATATALTAVSIGVALRQALAASQIEVPLPRGTAEYVASGGGVRNRTLMRMISEQVHPLGFRVLTS